MTCYGKDEIKNPKITNVEIIANSSISIDVTFNVDYSDELGKLKINKLYLDLNNITSKSSKNGIDRYIPTQLLLNSHLEYFEVELPEEPPLKLTMEEIEYKLGRKIILVEGDAK